MTKYNTFLTVFIISVIAGFAFLIFYSQAVFGMMRTMMELRGEDPDPLLFISTILTPQLLISAVVLGISSLTCRILGIVYVAKNKAAGDGEKALWIVGFVLLGFITAIVFLIMAKGRKHV
jgi:hypothetical protein